MPNIPDTSNALLLAWFEQHSALWQATPTAFGITAPIALALNAVIGQARKDFDSANAARLASKQATVTQNESFRDMRRDGGDVVNTIKAFIEQSGNTALWGQAGLEPPAPRGTTPPPTAAFELATNLDSEGNLTLTWKASQPRGVSGVVYFVRRSLNNAAFVQINTVGEKVCIDTTIPQGTTSVAYNIVAKRGGDQSPLSETIQIRFGHAPGGGLTIVSETHSGGEGTTSLAA